MYQILMLSRPFDLDNLCLIQQFTIFFEQYSYRLCSSARKFVFYQVRVTPLIQGVVFPPSREEGREKKADAD